MSDIEVIEANGLKVETVQPPDAAEPTHWWVSGRTFPHRDLIKSLEVEERPKWVGYMKAWKFMEDPTALLADGLRQADEGGDFVVREPTAEYYTGELKAKGLSDEHAELQGKALHELHRIREEEKAPVVDDSGRVPRVRGARELQRLIPEQIVNDGAVRLEGHQVDTLEDLAVLAQVYRDYRFETFRIVYTKGNEIVAEQGITSGIVNSAPALFQSGPGNPDIARAFYEMRDRMDRLGADGYYLLHNHPSGKPQASPDDARITKWWAQNLPGFKGHAIIDDTQFGSVWLDPHSGEIRSSTRNLPASAARPVLQNRIDVPDLIDLARHAKSVEVNPGRVVVLLADNAHKLRAVLDAPAGIFNHNADALNWLRGVARAYGAPNFFLHSDTAHMSEQQDEVVRWLIDRGHVVAFLDNRTGKINAWKRPSDTEG